MLMRNKRITCSCSSLPPAAMPMVLRSYLAKHDHARVVQPLRHQVTDGLHTAQNATGRKGELVTRPSCGHSLLSPAVMQMQPGFTARAVRSSVVTQQQPCKVCLYHARPSHA